MRTSESCPSPLHTCAPAQHGHLHTLEYAQTVKYKWHTERHHRQVIYHPVRSVKVYTLLHGEREVREWEQLCGSVNDFQRS